MCATLHASRWTELSTCMQMHLAMGLCWISCTLSSDFMILCELGIALQALSLYEAIEQTLRLQVMHRFKFMDWTCANVPAFCVHYTISRVSKLLRVILPKTRLQQLLLAYSELQSKHMPLILWCAILQALKVCYVSLQCGGF